jgi:hypothetical protein
MKYITFLVLILLFLVSCQQEESNADIGIDMSSYKQLVQEYKYPEIEISNTAYSFGDTGDDGDALIEPGESFYVDFLLSNVSRSSMYEFDATLSSDDIYVNIYYDTHTYPSLDYVGNSHNTWDPTSSWLYDEDDSFGLYSYGLNYFNFSIDPACPSGHEINFKLTYRNQYTDSTDFPFESNYTLIVD